MLIVAWSADELSRERHPQSDARSDTGPLHTLTLLEETTPTVQAKAFQEPLHRRQDPLSACGGEFGLETGSFRALVGLSLS